MQADSLPAEPQGKPKNTEGDSLPLLQLIFPTQESNLGLLHCRWVLYKLSYQGNPRKLNTCGNIILKSYLNESWTKWGIAMNWEWRLLLEYSFLSWQITSGMWKEKWAWGESNKTVPSPHQPHFTHLKNGAVLHSTQALHIKWHSKNVFLYDCFIHLITNWHKKWLLCANPLRIIIHTHSIR